MGVSVSLGEGWRPLFRPKKVGRYVNDHTVFKDKYGFWRLLGTTAVGDYAFYKERSFVEASTKDLWTEMVGEKMTFIAIPHRGIKIAPVVFLDKKKREYHLFFAGMNIYHFTSRDGRVWEDQGLAVHNWWPWLRDPEIVEWGGLYWMYLTDFDNQITIYKSEDLYQWKRNGVALKLGSGIPKSLNSACESSIVIPWKDYFILLTTITPATTSIVTRRENYTHTAVFVARDPTDFGVYATNYSNTSNLVGYLQVHAPEVIVENGQHYITTCGWANFPKADSIAEEGVFITKLNISEI